MAMIYSALLTAFNDDETIHEKGIEQLVRYELDRGVDGFYVTGSTGECFMMSVEERKQIMKLVAEVNAGRSDLIAHIGAISQKQAIELAVAAKEYGYTRISSVVPFYFDYTFENIVAYFESVSKAADLPIFVYNIPATTGKSFSLSQLYRLLDSECVCGLKHTSMDFFQLERLKNEYPNKTFLNGRDECFLSGLCVGADGMVGSTVNIIPHVYKRIAAKFSAGDLKGALIEQDKANRVIELLQTMEFNVGMKYILHRYGVESGISRKPIGKALRPKDIQLIEREIIPLIEQ